MQSQQSAQPPVSRSSGDVQTQRFFGPQVCCTEP